jgi:GMP synthase (glutamine-hydrolysing)
MMSPPTVFVLAHTQTDPLGILDGVLSDADLRAQCIGGFAGKKVPTEPGDAAGLIVLGGSMSVLEQARFPFLTDEMRLIENTLKRELPVLGICLGSQMLAHVLGGTVHRASQTEIGWHPVTMAPAAAQDALFRDFPPQMMGFHWHDDFVELPRDAVLLAHSQMTPCQAFRQGDFAYGIQFHLEVTEFVVRDWAANGAREIAAVDISADALLEDIPRYLPIQQRLGWQAFSRWVRLALSHDGEAPNP